MVVVILVVLRLCGDYGLVKKETMGMKQIRWGYNDWGCYFVFIRVAGTYLNSQGLAGQMTMMMGLSKVNMAEIKHDILSEQKRTSQKPDLDFNYIPLTAFFWIMASIPF